MVESGPTTITSSSEFPAASAGRRSTNQSSSSMDDVTTAARWRGARRYVGYIPDLLQALAALLAFRYELYPVPDASYGYRKAASREWSGLVGELVSEVRMYAIHRGRRVLFSASLSISIASGAVMIRACRLDHLSVGRTGKCIVAKRPIGSGCRLGW